MVALALALPAVAAGAPRALPPESSRCGICHESPARDGPARHPPAPGKCTSCHPERLRAAEGRLASTHAPVTDSCRTCHDLEGAGERFLVRAVPALCFRCHELDGIQGRHGQLLGETTDCSSCHDPHGSDAPHMLLGPWLHAPFRGGSCGVCHRKRSRKRLRFLRRGARLCTSCHGDLIAPGAASVHGVLDPGKNREVCLACHDPHVSPNRGLLRHSGSQLCAACHPRIAGAARGKGGHAPAAKSCSTCHRPHDSSKPHLLTRTPPGLCLGCHPSQNPSLERAHLGADPAALSCLECHDPHGTGHRALLARHLHPPILYGCPTCHRGAWDRLKEGGGSALCLSCHDDIGEIAAQSAVPHPAMRDAPCTACHGAHASPRDHLVSRPAGGECLACHPEKAAGEGEVSHGAIAAVGCRVCHEPHGGRNPSLLRDRMDAVCLGCHDVKITPPRGSVKPVRVLGRYDVPADTARAMASLRLTAGGTRNHPVARHRVLGLPSPGELRRNAARFGGELHCLSCHDPHKGRSRPLLRWGAGTTFEACAHCHPK